MAWQNWTLNPAKKAFLSNSYTYFLLGLNECPSQKLGRYLKQTLLCRNGIFVNRYEIMCNWINNRVVDRYIHYIITLPHHVFFGGVPEWPFESQYGYVIIWNRKLHNEPSPAPFKPALFIGNYLTAIKLRTSPWLWWIWLLAQVL